MSLDYAHELRLGLLAVDRGYVALDKLRSAILHWSGEPEAPMLESLFADSQLHTDQRSRVLRALDEDVRGSQEPLWKEPRFSEFLPVVEAACQRVRPPLNGILLRLFDPAAVLEIVDSIVESPATTLLPNSDVRLDEGPTAPVPPDLGAAPTDNRFAKTGDPGKQGGMGRIYLGLDRDFDRPVAIKEIRADKLPYGSSPGRDELVRRFEREARVTAGLQHPGIVPVYGLGMLDSGLPYFAMRYLDRGKTLHEKIKQFHGRPPGERDDSQREVQFRGLLASFVTACRTVEYAHQQGVLHRDLKPANIQCGDWGETLVLDWGLTPLRAAEDDSATEPPPMASTPECERDTPALTCAADPFSPTVINHGPGGGIHAQVSVGVGTAGYVSPEQLFGLTAGGPVGHQADVFSLGATLFHLLLGRRPPLLVRLPGDKVGFEKEAPADVADWELVPRALRAICLKALSLSLADRYPTAQALAEDVERWLADQPVAAWNDAHREPLNDRVQRWIRHHSLEVTGTVTLLLAGVVMLPMVFYWHNASQFARQSQLASQGRENLQRSATVEILDVVDDKLGASSGGAAVRHAMLLAVVETNDRLESTSSGLAESQLDPVTVARSKFESHWRFGELLSRYILEDPIATEGAPEAHKQEVRENERRAAEIAAAEFEAALALSRKHTYSPQFPVAERLELMILLSDLYLDPDLNKPQSAVRILEEAAELFSAPRATAGDLASPGKIYDTPSLGIVQLKLVQARLRAGNASEELLTRLPEVAAFDDGGRAEAAQNCAELAAQAASSSQPELALRSYALGIVLLQTCPDEAERASAYATLVELTLEAASLARDQGRTAESGRYAADALALLGHAGPKDDHAQSVWQTSAALDCYEPALTALDDAAHRESAVAVGTILAIRLRDLNLDERAGNPWRVPQAWFEISIQLWDAGRRDAALYWVEQLIPAFQHDADRVFATDLARMLNQRGLWLEDLGRPAEALPSLTDAVSALQYAPSQSDFLCCERAQIWLHLQRLHTSLGDEQSARAARVQALSELETIALQHWSACGQSPPTDADGLEACLVAVAALHEHLRSVVVKQEEPEELLLLIAQADAAWSDYDSQRAQTLLSAVLRRRSAQFTLEEWEFLRRRTVVCQAIEQYLAGASHALDDLAAEDRQFALECCARRRLSQSKFAEAVDLAVRLVNDEQGAPAQERLVAAAKIYALAYRQQPDGDPADVATVDVEPAAWDEWRAEAVRLLREAGAQRGATLPLGDADFASLEKDPEFRVLLRNSPTAAGGR